MYTINVLMDLFNIYYELYYFKIILHNINFVKIIIVGSKNQN